jgi:hypothetical protein
MIRAYNKDFYAYAKSEPQDTVTLVKLNRKPGIAYEEDYIMNVPPEKPVKELSPEKITANAIRLASEDSLRNAYMNTFIPEEQAHQWAKQNDLDKDEVWKYLNRSQGNWQEIKNFIAQQKNNPDLFPFLAALSEKDLRDTPASYLNNHLQNREEIQITEGTADNLIVPYILSPRIEMELIRPWRSFFQQQGIVKAEPAGRNTIASLIDFVKTHVTIHDDENYFNCRITPRGVYELQIADRRSRNIFFVALCRSLGIAARIETATAKPQYFENGKWTDVIFEPEESGTGNLPKAGLTVQNAATNIIKPGYYSHYTLASFKDGDFHTLDFENNPLVTQFPYQLELDEGYYRLMTGSRASDGSVFVHAEYFELKGNTSRTLNIRLPETGDKLFVKGIVDMNSIVKPDPDSKVTLKELSKGKGLILCFLDPGKEPSKHLLQDFPAVRQALDEWDGGVLLTIPDDKAVQSFDTSVFKGLPRNTCWSTDYHRELLKVVTGALQINFQDNFPLTVYLSRNGGILYSSTGYRIATGEEVLKIIRLE